MARKKRDFRKEYDDFHGKPEQIKKRAARNKARRLKGLKKGDKREVDHQVPLSKGGSNKKSNLKVKTRKANRRKAGK